MIKKIGKITAVCLIALICCAAVFACKDKEKEKPIDPEPGPSITAELTLNKSKLDVLLGDTVKLEASYNEITGATLEYESSDASVASVSSDGTVSAMKQGEATVTAKYAGETATCKVTVTTGGFEPSLHFEENIGGEITALRSDSVNLGTYVLFNEKEFGDAKLTYEYTNKELGEVDSDGLFTPVKTGKTTITIKANWRGLTNVLMEKSVSVTVKSGTIITVNNGGGNDLTLYTVASHGDKNDYATQMPFVVNVTEDDGETPVTGISVSVVQGSDLLDYDGTNKKIIAKGKYGTAKIAVSGNDELHGEIYREFGVEILRPVAESEYSGNLCASDGSLSISAVSEIFGRDTVMIDAESDTAELSVTGGKINGFTQTENVAPQEQNITVYDETVGYEITVKVYAGIIRTSDDFSKLISAPDTVDQSDNTNVNTLTGYYILENDIDMSGITLAVQGKNITSQNWDHFANVGFRGIFDGQGHTIKNFAPPMCGIFGTVGKGAVIKNIAFTGLAPRGYGRAALAGYICGATLDNLYFSGIVPETGCTALVASNVDSASVIKNCVFEATEYKGVANNAHGVIGYMLEGRWTDNEKPTDLSGWKDSFIIGGSPAVYMYASSYSYTVDGAYIDGKASTKADSMTYMNIGGIKRYTTRDKFLQDYAANASALSGFDARFWNTDCGIPVWGKDTKMSVIRIDGKTAGDSVNIAPSANNCEVSVIGAGAGALSCTVSLVSGSSVSVTDNKLSALEIGNSVIKVSYTYDGQLVEKNITVSVTLSADDAEDKTNLKYDFDISKGTFTTEQLNAIFGNGNATITHAMLGSDMLTVGQGGKLEGITVGNTTSEKTLVLATAEKTVAIKIVPWTKIFMTADDLFYYNGTRYSSYFDTSGGRFESVTIGGTSYKVMKGSYLVGEDIDLTNDDRIMKSYSFVGGSNYNTAEAGQVGFVGTFDGGGHTIIGMTVSRGGIFDIIGNAIIRNLALKNVKFEQAGSNFDYACILGRMICGTSTSAHASIRNVYISVANAQVPVADAKFSSVKYSNSSIVAGQVSQFATFDNFIVDLSALGDINVIGRGVFASGAGNYDSNVEKLFGNMKNSFVISKAPIVLNYGGDNANGRYVVVHDAYNKRNVDYSEKEFYWEYGTSQKDSNGSDYGIIFVDKTKNAGIFGSASDSLYRFESSDEMKTYIADNEISLDDFDGKYWDTTSGAPVWKTAA